MSVHTHYSCVILGGFPLLCVHVCICTHICMHKSSVCVCVCTCVMCTYMKWSDNARCFPQLLCTLFSEMGVSPELPPVIEGYGCALCMWVLGSKLECLCLYSKYFSAELSSHPGVPLLGALVKSLSLLSYFLIWKSQVETCFYIDSHCSSGSTIASRTSWVVWSSPARAPGGAQPVRVQSGMSSQLSTHLAHGLCTGQWREGLFWLKSPSWSERHG